MILCDRCKKPNAEHRTVCKQTLSAFCETESEARNDGIDWLMHKMDLCGPCIKDFEYTMSNWIANKI